MKFKIIALVMWILSASSFAQEHQHYHIKGEVISTNDEGEKSPVPGAKVWLKNGKDRVITDSQGRFQIKLDQVPDSIFIQATGFQGVAYSVEDTSMFYTFNVTEGLLLNGVEVVARGLGKTMDLIDPLNVERIGEEELRKAACCNLSESFETNASVDVNITDAVSGAKKIQMLGLDGVYTSIQWENIPLVRGLSTSYGLNFTPGTWIESIQITKGTGSVLNGYESMAGMINLELKKPDESERLYVNVYGNKFGRGEVNVHGSQRLNKRWQTMTFLHASNQFLESDVNKDGFRDMPIGSIFLGMHRWSFNGKNSEAKFGIKGSYADKMGGQLGSVPSDASAWNANLQTRHLELFAKNGYFFKKRKFASLGLIGQAKYHEMNNTFGNTNYEGIQRKLYINAIYGDIIGNSNHNIKTGASFLLDDYTQSYNDSLFLKTEIVPGIFAEYTFNALDKFIVVAGVRGDYHNLYGPLFTPRLHAKWNISKRNALRISIGRGYRVPNPYADYTSLMASSRVWRLDPNIQPEDGVSSGITFTQKFLIKDRVSVFTFDYFYTHFFNQFVVDMDVDPNEIYLYNTNGQSFAHSAQVEFSITPAKGWEVRAAGKYYNVQAEFNGELQQRAFVPRFRMLLNSGYSTRNKKWSFDITGNWVGQKRLPSMATNPPEYRRAEVSNSYWLLNSQITYNFKRFSVYIGGENILNVIQDNAIISADDPFGAYFDATQIWAPIAGANIYAGLHFAINHKKK